MRRYLGQHGVEVGAPIAKDQRLRGLGRGTLAEEGRDLHAFAGGKPDRLRQGRAGVERRAGAAGQRQAARQGGRRREAAAPPEERAAIPGERGLAAAQIGEGDAAGEGRSPGVAGEYRARLAVDLGRDERGSGPARGAEDPFGIARHRQVPGAVREVAQGQPRDLDRVVQGHVLHQIRGDAVGRMLEPRIAEPMAGDVLPSVADRLRGRAPEIPARHVADVEGFTRRIDHRVVRPRRQLVLAAVLGPAVAASLCRGLKAEAGIGDDVDPRRRRGFAVVEDRDIFAPVLVEAAETIEKFKVRTFCRHLGRPARRGHGRGGTCLGRRGKQRQLRR